jgi:hypothetical protein
MAVARERPCKLHVATGYCGDRGNATIEQLWRDVFSVRSVTAVLTLTRTYHSGRRNYKLLVIDVGRQ